MNDLRECCLFKRRPHAVAVAKLLNRHRNKKPGRALQVVAVKKMPKGFRFLEDVTDPWQPNKRWKPLLKRLAPLSLRSRPCLAKRHGPRHHPEKQQCAA